MGNKNKPTIFGINVTKIVLQTCCYTKTTPATLTTLSSDSREWRPSLIVSWRGGLRGMATGTRLLSVLFPAPPPSLPFTLSSHTLIWNRDECTTFKICKYHVFTANIHPVFTIGRNHKPWYVNCIYILLSRWTRNQSRVNVRQWVRFLFKALWYH